MAGALNKVQLIGNVGKAPEVRSLNNGDRVASFSLAMTETWKDKHSGERKERTEWANVVCFNDGLVKVIESYVSKGSKLYVEGALQTRKWTDQSGADRYTTEVVLTKFNGTLLLLGDKRETGEQRGGGGGGFQTDAPRESFTRDDLDDQIPFVSSGGIV